MDGPLQGYYERSVAFAEGAEEKESRLKRKNTPHHLKHARVGDPNSAAAKDAVAAILTHTVRLTH